MGLPARGVRWIEHEHARVHGERTVCAAGELCAQSTRVTRDRTHTSARTQTRRGQLHARTSKGGGFARGTRVLRSPRPLCNGGERRLGADVVHDGHVIGKPPLAGRSVKAGVGGRRACQIGGRAGRGVRGGLAGPAAIHFSPLLSLPLSHNLHSGFTLVKYGAARCVKKLQLHLHRRRHATAADCNSGRMLSSRCTATHSGFSCCR